MKTTIRINKKNITEETKLRNESSIIKETEKTITFEIHSYPSQSQWSKKQMKRNWNLYIY